MVAETRMDTNRRSQEVRCFGHGTTIVPGGILPNGRGSFYPPTVLSGVSDDADCQSDEVFGLAAAILALVDEDEIIARAKDTEYRLVAHLHTDDMRRGMRLAEQLEFGMVDLDRGLVSDTAAPFGNVEQSRLGREGGNEGMPDFQESQHVSTAW